MYKRSYVFLRTPNFYLPNQVFFWINVACHLWSNLQMCELIMVEEVFERIKCKATINFLFNVLWGFFMPFCSQDLTKGKQVSIYWCLSFYCLKWPQKLKIFQKLLRNKRCLQNGPTIIDGVQHQFNENCLDRQTLGFLRNT